ncbi:hypothetical protein PQX77_010009 [Marasmius sp. AFHP31]|nr:hypothetical protein PQX77_010009 [Marasmius sp. AFHP31]
MGSQFFHRATNTRIGDNNIFQHIGGNVNNYFNHTSSRKQEEDRIMPRQNEFREFLKGDICLQEQTWSEETELIIQIPARDNCPYQREVKNRVKVTKKFHTATIFQCGDQKFTVVTFEPKDKRNKETIRLLWKAAYEAYSRYKSPWLMQMLGLMTSEIPTFILHKELVNGDELFLRYCRNKIIWKYLICTRNSAFERLHADETLLVEISVMCRDWNFDLRTRTWQYDASTSQPFRGPIPSAITPLQLQGPNPELNAKEIITCFEQTFGDCLYLHALSERWWGSLPTYMENGLLTFGTVVDYWDGRTLAHISPPLSPEWSFKDYSHGMKVSYSMEGPSHVDWSLHKAHHARLSLYFSLCIPPYECIHLRMSYLCQSHLILASNTSLDPEDLTLIDCIGFTLFGNFSYDPTTGPTPAYLFVPHFWVDSINGMFCTYLPPLGTLFYWASDPNGINKIPEEDWGRYGIPSLQVEPYIGSSWRNADYDFVRDHLHTKGYEEDWVRYARDHGYPELILGDPHTEGQIQELSERVDEVHISDLQPHSQFFPLSEASFITPFHSQASDIPPSQMVWSTEEGYNSRKRREMEHAINSVPAKRARVATLEPSDHYSRTPAQYTPSTRQRSYGGMNFARVAQQTELGGLDPHGSARIWEWDHRQFTFNTTRGWNGHSTGIGGNDGRSCGVFLG